MALRLPDDFKEFLRLLNSHAVEYLLIGGYAVGHYGYPRDTAAWSFGRRCLPRTLGGWLRHWRRSDSVPVPSRPTCSSSRIRSSASVSRPFDWNCSPPFRASRWRNATRGGRAP